MPVLPSCADTSEHAVNELVAREVSNEIVQNNHSSSFRHCVGLVGVKSAFVMNIECRELKHASLVRMLDLALCEVN